MLRVRVPQNLKVYDVAPQIMEAQPGYIPSRRSIRTRLEHWIAGRQALQS
jgi:hypothetical protein